MGESGGRPSERLLVPTLAPDYRGAVALSAGRDHLCALMPSGQVICGGSQSPSGKLGYFQRSSGPYPPLPVPGLQDVIEIGSGPSHNCALTRSDEVYCWGSNLFRQLGQPFPMMRFDGPVRLPQP